MDPKATGWISLPSIRIFLDQRKVVTIEGHPGRSRTRSSFSWLSFSQRVNRVLCTGVGVVIVFTVLCWRDMAEMHKIVGYRARLEVWVCWFCSLIRFVVRYWVNVLIRDAR
jgi:hypothetical protein